MEIAKIDIIVQTIRTLQAKSENKEGVTVVQIKSALPFRVGLSTLHVHLDKMVAEDRLNRVRTYKRRFGVPGGPLPFRFTVKEYAVLE